MSKFPLDRNCFVTSVTLPFCRKFGPEALDWDPYTVRDAFETAFEVQKMPQRLFDKLNCGLALIGTTAFTDTIEGFLTGVACMNNLVFDESTAPFVDLTQCAWGVFEYMNLNGDVDKQGNPTETFCPEICKYIQDVAKLNGVVKLPQWLKFAQIPDSSLPDLSDDVTLFETFMARQQDYIKDLVDFVNDRQKKLAGELRTLKQSGLVG